MPRQVLVIGGSYFAGRVFAMLAALEFQCGRRDPAGLRSLPADRQQPL